MSGRLVGIAVLLAAASGGCATTPRTQAHAALPGDGLVTVARYRPLEPAVVTETPGCGTYGLYRLREESPSVSPADPRKPAEFAELCGLCRLPVHERVGFERGADGGLQAVAGQDRFPLAEGSYSWRGKPEPNSIGPPEPEKTPGEKVLHATAGVAAIPLGVLMLAVYVLASARPI